MMAPNVYDVESNLAEGKVPLVSAHEGEVRLYMRKVYSALAGMIGMATLGCAAQIQTGAVFHSGMSVLLLVLASLGLVIYLCSTRAHGNTTERIAALLAFGFVDGLLTGPLVNMAMRVNSSIVLSAFVLTFCIFLSFTAAARFAKRRSYVYLGGVLGACVIGLLVCSILSIFFNTPFFHLAVLYGGLVVFSLYIVFDTQMMIEKAHLGVQDHIYDALMLFVDLAAIFKRILIILMDREE